MTALSPSSSLGTTEQAVYIPEIWSTEVKAPYKKAQVMQPLIRTVVHNGRKGDTLRIPVPSRGTAASKAESTAVTLINDTATDITIVIDQHFHYARMLDDIADMQGLESQRSFLTDDAGYSLADQSDWAIHLLARADHSAGAVAVGSDIVSTAYDNNVGNGADVAVIGSDGTTAWNPAANTNTGNAAALADNGLRRIHQTLDDNNVPMSDRCLVVPPVEKNNLLTADSNYFVRADSVGETGGANSIRTGLIGDIYGASVYVSTQCANADADDNNVGGRACLFFQKDALAIATQLNPRLQAAYMLENLSTLFVADIIYGTRILRNEGLVTVIVAD